MPSVWCYNEECKYLKSKTAKAKKEAKEEALELANDWFC